jgi:uncharacterized protein YwgA
MATTQADVLATVLKRIGGFDPIAFAQDFDARLRVQKEVHLLQAGFDVDLGYAFNYYLRGPYSSGLARDVYAITPSVFAKAQPLKFKDPPTEARFQEFLRFVTPHLSDAAWLETASTLLWHIRQGVADPNALQWQMAAKGKPITDDYCQSVLSDLRSVGIINKTH